jgi:hypothetical protein
MSTSLRRVVLVVAVMSRPYVEGVRQCMPQRVDGWASRPEKSNECALKRVNTH